MIHAILILLAIIAATVLFGRRRVQGMLWQWCSAMLGVIVVFYLIIGAAYFTGISVWSAFWAVCGVLFALIIVSAVFEKPDLPRKG